MKEIQLKKKEWQDKKEILQNSNEALQAEATQLEAEILSAVERQKNSIRSLRIVLLKKRLTMMHALLCEMA